MEIKVLEEKKNKLVFELQGETHSVAGILSKELQKEEHVKNAAYTITHPLTPVPRFFLETDGADARKILQSVAKKLQKQVQKLRDAAAKEL